MIDAFILSSPRSGSTLLRLNLDKIPRVVALPETHFFRFLEAEKVTEENFAGRRGRILEAWLDYHTVRRLPIDKGRLGERLEAATGVLDVLELTIQSYCDYLGVEKEEAFIIEKSPPHIFYLDPIASFYPDAKLIFLIRDPRDVVASLKGVDWSKKNTLVNARVWRNGVRRIRPGNFTMRYEDLVREPAAVFEALGRYLGLDVAGVDFAQRSRDPVEEGVTSSTQSLKAVDPSLISAYRHRLSAEARELEIIQHVCREEMEEHGYELDPCSYDLRFRIRLARCYLDYLMGR